MIATNVKFSLSFEIKSMTIEKFHKLMDQLLDNKSMSFEELLEIYPIDKTNILMKRIEPPLFDRSLDIGHAEIDLIC